MGLSRNHQCDPWGFADSPRRRRSSVLLSMSPAGQKPQAARVAALRRKPPEHEAGHRAKTQEALLPLLGPTPPPGSTPGFPRPLFIPLEGVVFTPILQLNKLEFREAKQLSQGHTTGTRSPISRSVRIGFNHMPGARNQGAQEGLRRRASDVFSGAGAQFPSHCAQGSALSDCGHLPHPTWHWHRGW